MSPPYLLSLAAVLAVGPTIPETGAGGPQTVRLLGRVVRLDDGGARPARALVAAIAAQAGLPCVFDHSVAPALANRRIPLETAHLNAYEALTAVAQSLGLGVVVLPGTAVLTSPEQMPEAWAALAERQRSFWQARRAASDESWAARLGRRAPCTLIDVTLPAALRRLGAVYGTDVLASGALWREQTLFSLPGEALTLRDALAQIAGQCNAQAVCRDGVVWLTRRNRGPAGQADPGRVVVVAPTAMAETAARRAGAGQERPIRGAMEGRTPAAWLAALGAVGPAGTLPTEPLELSWDGPRGDVLEVARLLWGLRPPRSEDRAGERRGLGHSTPNKPVANPASRRLPAPGANRKVIGNKPVQLQGEAKHDR